jgi:hypothetical protein
MRLRDGLIAGRSHLALILLLVGLFFLLQWLEEVETGAAAAGSGEAVTAPVEPARTALRTS